MGRRFSIAIMGLMLPTLWGCAHQESKSMSTPRMQDSTQTTRLETQPKSPPPNAHSQAPTPSPVATPRVTQLGESVGGRPIELYIFGHGRPTIFIHGGIHGNEVASVFVAQRLIEELRRNPSIYADRRVAIIPCANPDGYAARRRTNRNGVDLNRNFPARDFKSTRGNGAQAVSEPETRAIVRAMEMLNPDAIVTLHATTGGRECNNYDGPAKALADLMSRYNGWPVRGHIGYETPGSFGRWAGRDQGIPTFTLELPFADAGERSWQLNGVGLVSLIGATQSHNANAVTK